MNQITLEALIDRLQDYAYANGFGEAEIEVHRDEDESYPETITLSADDYFQMKILLNISDEISSDENEVTVYAYYIAGYKVNFTLQRTFAHMACKIVDYMKNFEDFKIYSMRFKEY